MEILLLGTIHLGETTDAIQLTAEEKNQFQEQQFEILTNDLATFKPDQIFVEYPYKLQHELHATYKNNSAPDALQKNEIYQIGFRLANKLSLDTITAVDWNEEILGLPGLEALSHGHCAHEFKEIMQRANQLAMNYSAKLKEGNIIDLFKFINSKEQNKLNHQIYLDLLALEDDIAFNWVVNYWYYRNLKIVQNIQKSIKPSTKRTVLIYGTGHNYLLKQQLEDISNIQVISYDAYENIK